MTLCEGGYEKTVAVLGIMGFHKIGEHGTRFRFAADGSALAGTDYTTTSGTFSFLAGESSKTITIPLTTYQGRSDTPGDAGGYGPLDGDDARDLAAAAARHPRTRWCLTALNPDGTAAAHACLPGRHSPPATGPPGQANGVSVRQQPGDDHQHHQRDEHQGHV